MAPYQFAKRYQNFFGYDLRSNDLEFPEQRATDVKNIQYTATGTIEKRTGFQPYGASGAKYGLFVYNRINSSGVEQPEILGASNTVQKFVESTLSVTYSGADPVAEIILFFDPTTDVYRCQISEGTTQVLDYSLGLGRDDAVPITLSDLKTQIDAIAGGNFSATITGSTTVPAAFLKPIPLASLKSGAVTSTAGYWTTLNISPQTGKSGPLVGSETNKNADNFENVTSVQVQNSIYFSNGYDPVIKYDGQNVYRAGLPPASDGSTGTYTTTASVTTGSEIYIWRQQFVNIDNNGIYVEGNTVYSPSYNTKGIGGYVAGAQAAVTTMNVDNGSGGNHSIANGSVVYFLTTSGTYVTKTVTAVSGTTITFVGAVTVADNVEVYLLTVGTVTVSNIQANSGFNTNCALISGSGNGAGSSTTIPVTAGFTIKAGDTAYLWDTTASGQYVTASVTSVDTVGNTITINKNIGYTNSTTNSRNVISNNLRIKILRNKNTGTTPTLFFELVEIPNNSFSATSTYVDSNPDPMLSAQFLEPATDRSPPVSGKYISAYQNIMVTAGNLTNPNEVSFSDIENPEYFPLVKSQFTVTNLQGDLITGLHPSNENFIIFQSRAIHSVTGDVPNQTFRVDVITQDIGCAAHASIQDVRGTICFLSLNGPRVMTGNTIPRGLGQAKDSELNSRIDPLFNAYGKSDAEILKTKRAVAINDRKREKYIIFVPAESSYLGDVYTNENSVTIVYDYTRDAWLKWTELDCTSGLALADSDNEILFIERRFLTNAINNYVYRFQNSGTYLDFQDHNQAIECYHKSPWEFLGEAGVLKNFTRIKVYSSELVDSPFNIDIDTEKDFIANVAISSCTLSFGGDGYGLNEYGEIYGDPSLSGVKHKLSNGRCVSLRVILSNIQEQTNIAITGYELEMALPYQPGFKR